MTDNRNEVEKKAPKVDYTLREKVIWKGTMAPKGWFYLVMTVKAPKVKYTKVELINRNVVGKAKEELLGLMRQSIKVKFGY
tara:strand:- start:1676 stop:1918 length:243 start_codon:yes stop_codon:yes gene_type:complete